MLMTFTTVQREELPQRIPEKPTLKALSYALRHKEMWPTGFWWEFAFIETCAMGLASEIWGGASNAMSMSELFDMPLQDARDIFLNEGNWATVRRSLFSTWFPWVKTPRADLRKVTPEMVADQIDKYLARA